MELHSQFSDILANVFTESPAHFSLFLDAYDVNNVIFHEKEKVFVQLLHNVNSLLGSSETRVKGLLILDRILPDCSQEQLSEFHSGWLQILHKIFIHGGECEVKASSRVIIQLVHIISQQPDHMKQVVTTSVPVIVNTLIATPHKNVLHHLTVISSFLKLFRGPCGPLRGKILNYVLQHFDSDLSSIRELSARCISLVPAAGGAGSQGLNHSQAWLQMCKKVLQSLRITWADLLNLFHTDRSRVGADDEMDLGLPALGGDVFTSYVKQKNRIQTLLLCLQELISLEVDITINIPLDLILQEICIFLTFGGPHKGSASLEGLLLHAVMPAVHKSTLKVLQVLIKTCGSNLLPFTDVINKTMVQVLSRTAGKNKMAVRSVPYSELRVQVYETMMTWLVVEGASCSMEEVSEQLAPLLLSDIVQPDLMVDRTSGDHKLLDGKPGRKRKRMRLAVNEGVTSAISARNGDVNLARMAAKVCRHLILTCGHRLPPSLHVLLTEEVLQLLARYQVQLDAWLGDPSLRRHCYQLLGALALNPHPFLPPALQPALAMLQTGARDPHVQVSGCCKELVAVTQTIIHPRNPPLNMPVPIPVHSEPHSMMMEDDEQEPSDFSEEDEEEYLEDGEYGMVCTDTAELARQLRQEEEEEEDEEEDEEEEEMDESSEESEDEMDPYDDLPPAHYSQYPDYSTQQEMGDFEGNQMGSQMANQMDSDIEVIDLSPDSSPIRRPHSEEPPHEGPAYQDMTSQEAPAYHEMTSQEAPAYQEAASEHETPDDSLLAASTVVNFDSTADRQSAFDTTTESQELDAEQENTQEMPPDGAEDPVNHEMPVIVEAISVAESVDGTCPQSPQVAEEANPDSAEEDRPRSAESPAVPAQVSEETNDMMSAFVAASPDPE